MDKPKEFYVYIDNSTADIFHQTFATGNHKVRLFKKIRLRQKDVTTFILDEKALEAANCTFRNNGYANMSMTTKIEGEYMTLGSWCKAEVTA